MSSLPTVITMLAERVERDPGTIQADTVLETLNVDSLTMIELIFDLEDEFKVSLGDERPNLVVVQDIADFIDRYVNQKAAQP